MENQAEKLRDEVSSSFHALAREYPQFQDAQMLVGASDASAKLQRQSVHRSVDVEWIQVIEDTLPYLDLVLRHPTVMIEDVEEVTPVELARHITDKSIRHLSQHTHLILKMDGDEVIPSKILNIRRDESFETYENRFINTLIQRLFNFVTIRYRAISQGYGTQQTYQLDYHTDFSHGDQEHPTNVTFDLHMHLDAPVTDALTPEAQEHNENYAKQVARAEKIYHTVAGFTMSKFVKQVGPNYIRPPVIRTNAILKNKNMNACLGLWEYLDTYSKAGFTEVRDAYEEMPSEQYIRELYSSVALQYIQFYNGVLDNQSENRLLQEAHLDPVMPEFSSEEIEISQEEYDILHSHYEKIAPISRLMNNRKKLSPDEMKIRKAIDIAISADIAQEQKRLAEEAERRRLEREAEQRRLAEEAEQKRLAEEARRLAEEEEARRIAQEEEQRRLAEEAEQKRLAQEEEAKRLAEEAEAKRIAEQEAAAKAELEARLVEEELEALRLAAEEQAQEDAAAAEKARIQQELLERKQAEEQKKAEDLAIAESLYYYSREDYLSLPRKKKKKILMELKKLHNYEAALVLLSDANDPNIRVPLPPVGKDWDEIRRWERCVVPSKKE